MMYGDVKIEEPQSSIISVVVFATLSDTIFVSRLCIRHQIKIGRDVLTFSLLTQNRFVKIND